MAENEYDYLEKALPGFSQARLIVKAAGDSTRPLGFKGSKFELSADRPRSGILSRTRDRTTSGMTKPRSNAPFLPAQNMGKSSFLGRNLERCTRETSLLERRVVATESRPVGRALRTSSEGKHDEASEAVRRTRASGEAEAKQVSTMDLAVLTHAACIRHIFAHGRLTAHPNGLPAENMTAICDALSSFITDFIRSDFHRMVQLADVATRDFGK